MGSPPAEVMTTTRRPRATSAPGTTGGPSATSGGTTAGTATGTSAAAGEGVPGGTLRVGLVGSTNDIIDGQYIVAKGDQARLVAGWETLVDYDADFNISYEQRPGRGDRDQGRRQLRHPAEGRHQVPRRQADHRRRRHLLVRAPARPGAGAVAGAGRVPRRQRPDEGRRPHRRGQAAQAGGHVHQRPRRVHGNHRAGRLRPLRRRRLQPDRHRTVQARRASRRVRRACT